MGLIRFFLAISVVIAHAGSERLFFFVSGKVAVEIFFIISGFYMAMVMQSYLRHEHGVLRFYKSRYLRLFPAYIVVVVPFYFFVRQFTDISGYAPVTQLYTYLVSFSMLGYETLSWMGYNSTAGNISLLDDIRGVAGQTVPLDMVPYMRHMWSVGIEISFYLLAPFMLVGKRKVVILFLVALLLHAIISVKLGTHHPLRYRSLFNFAYLFLIGALVYQHVYPLIERRLTGRPARSVVALAGASAVLGLLFANEFRFVGAQGDLAWVVSDAYKVVCFLLCCVMFAVLKDVVWDRQIGDLSYVIYVVHWPLVMVVLKPYQNSDYWLAISLSATLVAALLINIFVERPVEHYRSRYKRA